MRILKAILALSLLALPAQAATRNVPADTVQFTRKSGAPGNPLAGTIFGYVLDADGKYYVKNSAGTAKACAYEGDITNAYLSGSAGINNANMATMAEGTFKCRTSAGTGAPEDCTGTQATARLDAFTGDSGSGGVKGLVPAPASGDAAADKFLEAGGGWLAAVTTMGSFGASPNADGASISGKTITLQPADASNPGGISTTAQDIPGNKRFLEPLGMAHETTPANPAAGHMKLYFKSDGSLYSLDSAGAETEIAGGVGGGGNCETFNENPQTGTTYTLTSTDMSDAGDCPWTSLTNASAITVTVPLNATTALTVNSRAVLVQGGAGRVCLSPESGTVTIDGNPCTSGPFARMYVDKVGTNAWKVSGQTEGLVVSSSASTNCTMTTSTIYDVWDCLNDTTVSIVRGSTTTAQWAAVGGGGSGGASPDTNHPGGGGGGGGGVTTATGVSLSPGTIVVDVGAGGVSTTTIDTNGTAGSDTVISGTAGISTTAGGGGFGAQYNTSGNGGNGRATNGSGGGGSYNGGPGGPLGGTGSGTGGDGGAGGSGGNGCGGGGGGAGGSNASNCTGNNGTAGTDGAAVSLCGGAYSSTWGGGGGGAATTTSGAGGAGGGAAGIKDGATPNATANLGGGGGGRSSTSGAKAGGAGGSGRFVMCWPSRYN